MNWDAIGAVGEMLGATGVIVTMLYLTAQIREARRATQAVVIWEKAKAIRDMSLVWYTNPEVPGLMFEYGRLTEGEFNRKFEEDRERSFQYQTLNRATLENYQAIYLTAADDDERRRLAMRIRTTVETVPGFRWIWPRINTPGAFEPRFVALMQSEVDRLGRSGGPEAVAGA